MAEQVFLTGNALTNKAWSLGVEAEVLKKISFAAFMGRRSDALLQVKDELMKGPGDQVTIGLRMQMDETVAAPSDVDVLTGNEKTLTFNDDALVINIIKEAIAWDTHMSRQRINFEMLDEAKNALADYIAAQLDLSFFNQLGGIAGITDLSHSGCQGVIEAPDAGSLIFATDASGVAAANEAAIALAPETYQFNLYDLDRMVEIAKTRSPAIRPAWIPFLNRELFVLFIPSESVTNLRKGYSTEWADIEKQKLSGGQIDNNAIVRGSLGVINDVLIVESTRVPLAPGQTEVKRCVFAGAQAGALTWGRIEGNPERFLWVEEGRNYGQVHGCAGYTVMGLKKLTFDSVDFASLVLSVGVVPAV